MASGEDAAGALTVGTVLASFSVLDDSGDGQRRLDVERLIEVLWNAELVRDSRLNAVSIALRVAGNPGEEPVASEGDVPDAEEPPAAKAHRAERTRPSVAASNGLFVPAGITIHASGRVSIATSKSVAQAKRHAEHVTALLRSALETLSADRSRFAEDGPGERATEALPAHVCLSRFRVDTLTAFWYSFTKPVESTDPATGATATRHMPVSRSNGLHLQLLHSRLSAYDGAALGARVDVLSAPHDKAVRVEIHLRTDTPQPTALTVGIEHTGVASMKRGTSLDDFSFAVSHILAPMLREARRS
jgi:hypothetical protein